MVWSLVLLVYCWFVLLWVLVCCFFWLVRCLLACSLFGFLLLLFLSSFDGRLFDGSASKNCQEKARRLREVTGHQGGDARLVLLRGYSSLQSCFYRMASLLLGRDQIIIDYCTYFWFLLVSYQTIYILYKYIYITMLYPYVKLHKIIQIHGFRTFRIFLGLTFEILKYLPITRHVPT